MKQMLRKKDVWVLLAALIGAFACVTLIQFISGRIDGVASMVFLLAVFFVSMYTDGYWWGVAGSVISVLAVNFAFRTPYFAFNFTIPENIFSGVVMLVVSFMTSTLTTRIKKQEQLRMESETEKMRANLLRAVSHDLRTPLTSIYGACSTVIDNYDSLGREQKIKLLSEACADAQWLNRMVENLLSVTRIDADGVAIQKTPTVLEELIDTVLVRFQKLHPGVPVEVKLPDDFIVIPMDSMLIQQVLTNLLENAVLHAKGMTCLTLRVFTLGQRAVFEVIDNGCGIPKERLKTLFTGGYACAHKTESFLFGRRHAAVGIFVVGVAAVYQYIARRKQRKQLFHQFVHGTACTNHHHYFTRRGHRLHKTGYIRIAANTLTTCAAVDKTVYHTFFNPRNRTVVNRYLPAFIRHIQRQIFTHYGQPY